MHTTSGLRIYLSGNLAWGASLLQDKPGRPSDTRALACRVQIDGCKL